MRNLTGTAPLRIVSGLKSFGSNVAIAHSSGVLSYAELADHVATAAARFVEGRRLVAIAIDNSVEAITAYLAALTAQQPVILLSPDAPENLQRIIDVYQPDTIFTPEAGWTDRNNTPQHVIHPDLALLLSTSGSTGSPKLVRLSYENLDANAEAIAEYLGIASTDRAATTLPLHYCYGLSVLHSYLVRGAGLILTQASVAEPEFWTAFRNHEGTSLAGVPYTFDLLDKAGFAEMHLPSLRYITQAGGRMEPHRVRDYALLGRERGWELVVMYGQTEATARMAYLPPEHAATRPEAIGVPIPGGQFRIEPLGPGDEPGTGELVYMGPNVMLGYAETPADLARGREVDELRTGDIARRSADGMYEIVGRRSRFAKLFGLRIDLQQLEAALRTSGADALAAASDDHISIAVTSRDSDSTRSRAAELTRLPAWAFTVVSVPELPRLANGKPDYQSVLALRSHAGEAAADIAGLFSRLLNVPRGSVSPNDSFVSLGGNSLSYVTMSVQLEKHLGTLPARWHTRAIAELEAAARPRSRFWRTIETPVLLRAAAIVAIVGVHVPLWKVLGGAHILLAVAGYMFARFTLASASLTHRRRALAKALAGVALPSIAWITAVYLTTDWYELSNVFLVNKLAGPHTRTSGVLWFIEVLALILLGAALLLSIPAVSRLQQRHPFGLPLGLTLAGIAFRHGLPWAPLAPKDAVYLPLSVWLFTLGWAGWAARNWQQRAFVTALAAVFLPTYFESPDRGLVVLAGVALLLWVRAVKLPAPAVWAAALVAHSSLYIYLTHWQVFPFVRDELGRWPALIACLAAGILYHRAGSALLSASLSRVRSTQ